MFWKRQKQSTLKVPTIEIPESRVAFANDFAKKKRLDVGAAKQNFIAFDDLPLTYEACRAANKWFFVAGYALGLEHSLDNLHLLEKEDEQD